MSNEAESEGTFVYFPWHRVRDIPQGVKRVIVHESCVKIEDGAFENCSELIDIKLPKDVVTIGKNAFLNCTSLNSINIPQEVREICSGAFHGCLSLQTINIPDKVEKIEEETFAYCQSLLHVNFPTTLKEIGPKVFYNCTSLRSVNLPTGLLKIGDGTFQFCEDLLSCRIPMSIEYIGRKAFASCETLMTIALPKTLKNIADDAFEDCDMLNEEAALIGIDVKTFLQTRLKKLPVHALIYYQIDKASLLDDLKKFAKHNKKAIAMRDRFGVTTLHLLLCSDHAHIETVEWLVNQNPDALNAKDRVNRLPVHKAIYAAKAYDASDFIIQLLLWKDKGNSSIYIMSTVPQSDIKIGREKPRARPDRKALPPTHGNSDKVESLLVSHQDGVKEMVKKSTKKKGEGGTGIKVKNRLALHYALEFNGSVEVIGHLLHKDIYNRTIFVRHDEGYLPLHFACRKGVDKSIIKLLIQRDHENYSLLEDGGFDFYRDRTKFSKDGIEKLVEIGIELKNFLVFDAIFTGANSLLFQNTILNNIDNPFILKWLTRISTERSVVVTLMLEFYGHLIWLVASIVSIRNFVAETYRFEEQVDIKPMFVSSFPWFIAKLISVAILSFLTIKKMIRLGRYNHLDDFFSDAWNYFALATVGLVLWSTYYIEIEGVTYGEIRMPDLLMMTILFQFFYFLSFLRKIRLSFSIFVGGFLSILRGLIPFLFIFYALILMFSMMYFVLENEVVKVGDPVDVNLRSGPGYFPFNSIVQSFRNTMLLVFIGPTMMDSWVDGLFGMMIVILLLNGVILAVVAGRWEQTKAHSKQIFFANRLHFLGSFRKISTDPHFLMQASQSIYDRVVDEHEGWNWKPLMFLVNSFIFVMGFLTCGLAWTGKIRELVFGVYSPKQVSGLNLETHSDEDSSNKEKEQKENLEKKVDELLKYLKKKDKPNKIIIAKEKSSISDETTQDDDSSDASKSNEDDKNRKKLKEITKRDEISDRKLNVPTEITSSNSDDSIMVGSTYSC